MSAMLLSFAAIDAALTAAAQAGVRVTVPGELANDGNAFAIDLREPDQCTEFGQMLFEANAASLATLYQDRHGLAKAAERGAELYSFTPYPAELTPGFAAAALAFIRYQCDAADSWDMSLADYVTLRASESIAFKDATQAERDSGWSIAERPDAPDLSALADEIDAAATAGDGEEGAPVSSRASLLARMGAALCGGDTIAIELPAELESPAALADAPEPAQDPAPGPQPEPELAAAKARKPGKGKAPAGKAKRAAPATPSAKAARRVKGASKAA